MYSPIKLDIIRIFGNGQEERKKMGFDHYHDAHVVFVFKHTPELFPDVARELQKQGYVLELLKVDTIKSVLKISRFDIKKDTIISYKKLLPLIDQEESTLVQLLNLFK